jgi:alanine dehydrogenase
MYFLEESDSSEDTAQITQEKLLEKYKNSKKISVGIPNDNKFPEYEKRVPLTPQGVKLLVDGGNEVVIQSGAGLAANYSDNEYSEHGAVIAESMSQVYNSDIIIKVAPFTEKDTNLMKGNQVVMSYLNILRLSEEVLNKLIQKRVTAIAFERLRDIDGSLPIVESMSEISGVTSILMASEYLSNYLGGKGVMLGGITGITPTEVVILGANTAGKYAAKAALGLGAQIIVFDDSLNKLRQFESFIGHRVQTSVFHPQVLSKALLSADVMIGAMELDDLRPWYYVSEDMVRTMKKGAVIIDLSIDRGGCIETTECRTLAEPAYEKFGVIHFSAWNLPSRVARTASMALSNILCPLIQNMSDAGNTTTFLSHNPGTRQGVYLYNGILTNETLGSKFGMMSKNLDLMLSVY